MGEPVIPIVMIQVDITKFRDFKCYVKYKLFPFHTAKLSQFSLRLIVINCKISHFIVHLSLKKLYLPEYGSSLLIKLGIIVLKEKYVRPPGLYNLRSSL